MRPANAEYVYFTRLVLENVKSFGNRQQLDLTDKNGRPARWTLILGDNGVGKTTLLQCLALMRPTLTLGEKAKTNAPQPDLLQPSLFDKENSEIAALARIGQTSVKLEADLSIGRVFGDTKMRSRPLTLRADFEVKDNDLAKILPHRLRRPGFVEPVVIGYGAARHSRYRSSTPYGEVPLSQLSLGYQTMTAWAVDLAWRLYQSFPDSDEPLSRPAIVMVDELDLHLHPRWQRQLRTDISDAFPNVQFIATAHSPLLAQDYLDANLAVVREVNGQAIIDDDPTIVRTWRLDEVVTSALCEVESPYSVDVQRRLDRRTALLQERKLSAPEAAELGRVDIPASFSR